MGNTFKPGDKIRRTGDTMDSGKMVHGDIYTVREPTMGGKMLHLEGLSFAYQADRFELVPTGPWWSDVEPGDTVKVRYKKTGEQFTTVAHETFDHFNGPEVLGHDLNSRLTGERFELLSIEKPRPVPPTTPGSHILARPETSGGVHLFLTSGGVWVNTHKANWSLASILEQGFEVIHDAGKDAS